MAEEILTQAQRQLIADHIVERGAQLPCPRCGNHNFSVNDGYFSLVLQSDVRNIKLAGTLIPVASIVCTRCGFLALHALGTLGLKPADADPQTDEVAS